jgi:leader peptidase (prepilin peptidase)/N-methyltransferase
VIAILAAAGLILAIRLAYWIVRRQEGIGLGDAKLMAMLGAWFGLRGSMEAFLLAVLAASATATVWLVVLAIRRDSGDWAKMPLPLGTFLCAAGLVEVFYPAWLLNPARFSF